MRALEVFAREDVGGHRSLARSGRRNGRQSQSLWRRRPGRPRRLATVARHCCPLLLTDAAEGPGDAGVLHRPHKVRSTSSRGKTRTSTRGSGDLVGVEASTCPRNQDLYSRVSILWCRGIVLAPGCLRVYSQRHP